MHIHFRLLFRRASEPSSSDRTAKQQIAYTIILDQDKQIVISAKTNGMTDDFLATLRNAKLTKHTVWKPCLQDFSKHERIIPPLDDVLFFKRWRKLMDGREEKSA